MFTYRLSDLPKELGENTPLPELTLYDLLDQPSTSKEQNLDTADNVGDIEQNVEQRSIEKKAPSNEVLNTPVQKKAPIVRILENKRIVAPMGAALKNMLGGPVKVVGVPAKTPQTTEIKILNKLQTKPINTIGNTTVKIGNTTIASPSGSTSTIQTTTPKNISGVTMTPIKTADGKLIFLQKSTAGVTAAKVPVTASSSRATTQLISGGSSIRQTIVSKSVPSTSTDPIKNSVTNSAITVRGVTAVGATPTHAVATTTTTTTATTPQSSGLIKNPASADTTAAPVATKMPIQVVRTADGKLIKLNQSSSPLILNTKPTALAVRAPVSTAQAKPTAILNSSGSKLINKPSAQVIIKGPLKQMSAGSSIRPVVSNTSTSTTITSISSSNSSTTTSETVSVSTGAAAVPSGKMLVQSSTGKQIVVPSKNIIKLSPKASTSSGTGANTNTNTNTTPSGVHAIQLPGKSGVQYVRVLPNNNTESTTNPQKVSLGRPRTSSNNNNSNTNNNSSTVSLGNTAKIVMKTTGGNIVPLPSMQTLVPRRAPVASSNAANAKNGNRRTSLEIARKHRLSDINLQIKPLPSESGTDGSGPDAKKARYVIAMANTSSATSGTVGASSTTTTPASQKHLQKIIGPRKPQVQRVTVQGAGVTDGGGSSNPTRKVYNLVTKSDANGVKYMICNKTVEGKPRTVFNTTIRRGYTLADTKLRRPISLTPQQFRLKQMKQNQQRQLIAKQRQQQLHKQHKPPTLMVKSQAQQPSIKPAATQNNKIAVPSKPLFDILKPPPAPIPTTTETLGALGGARRKHCNCSKSQCLKLYCDCFANGEFCQDCTCKDCFNNLDYEVKRERAIRSCLERNPSAFKPKITAPNSGDMRLHNKGCNCKRSGCLKNYCECYEAKIPCSGMCKCVGCRNMEDRPDVDMDSMESLTDVKMHPNKLKDINGTYLPHNRSNVYLTDDVIEATVMCMISRIVMHEKQNMPIEDTEREVMEELGESLKQIITFAKEKNETFHTDEPKTTA